jgi:hypothetical protein
VMGEVRGVLREMRDKQQERDHRFSSSLPQRKYFLTSWR